MTYDWSWETLREKETVCLNGMLFSCCCVLDGDDIFEIFIFLPWHVCSLPKLQVA